MTTTHPQSVAPDTSAFQNTDDAEIATVLAAIRHCANSWDGSARLLGNIRARDISRACDYAIKALTAPETARSPPSFDLVQRCRELLEWSRTGLLHGGSGGQIRVLTEKLRAKGIPDSADLSVAELTTRDEAMAELVRLSTRPAGG